MKLKQLIEKYIAHRRTMGEKFKSNAVTLKAFYRAVGENCLASKLPRKKVLAFLYNQNQITTGWFIKYADLRGFYDYALCRGYIKHCPLPKELPKRPLGLVPYIYSVQELRLLFDTALIYQKNKSLVEPYVIKVLLQLLYATGLRLSEALSLTIDDIDMSEMIITILETKFYKKRYVPFNKQTLKVLNDYLAWRQGIPSRTETMFISKKGLPLCADTIRGIFQRIRQKACVIRIDKSNCQPRLHDLRHTFAVHRLISWYREKKDVQKLLPVLSTYMGHTYLAATSVYLTMTTELLHEAGSRFQQYAQGDSK